VLFRSEASEFAFQIGVDAGDFSGAATLAIRPEDIAIQHEAGDGVHVDAKIYEIEPLGAFTIVDVSIGEKILKIQEAGMPQYELGQPVKLFIDPAKCHLFAGDTGDLLRSAE